MDSPKLMAGLKSLHESNKKNAAMAVHDKSAELAKPIEGNIPQRFLRSLYETILVDVRNDATLWRDVPSGLEFWLLRDAHGSTRGVINAFGLTAQEYDDTLADPARLRRVCIGCVKRAAAMPAARCHDGACTRNGQQSSLDAFRNTAVQYAADRPVQPLRTLGRAERAERADYMRATGLPANLADHMPDGE